MPRLRPPVADTVHQLLVTLRASDPPIWRRVQVPSAIHLDKLHKMLQTVMNGWEDSHLHQFLIDDQVYGQPDPIEDAYWGITIEDERHASLGNLLSQAGTRFLYIYDFGDGWEHDLLVEEIHPRTPECHPPVCLDGAQACPPENSGGIWGFYDMLEIRKDPNHEDYPTITRLLGTYDPHAFCLQTINRRLARFRPR